jgi:hypothetical protein
MQNRNDLCVPVVCFPFYYLWALFLQILPLANAFSKTSTKIRQKHPNIYWYGEIMAHEILDRAMSAVIATSSKQCPFS